MKLNRANRNALISIFTLITVIFLLGYFKNTSKYQPKPIVIKTINDKSIFNLEDRIECVPGHTSEGSPYTKSLTPGGYEIEDGIGGSLI
jgi:hypothetical protein